MRIKILSDSTCDLPATLVNKHGITLVPLNVVKGGVNYLDGVNITAENIFDHVAAGGDLCSTAAVSIGEYHAYFEKYSAEYDAVLHINIGSDFSASYQNACLAAAEYDNVVVVDSRLLTTGQGMVVLEASRLAGEGKTAAEIVQLLKDFIPRVEVSFILDRLDYMVKGGRCGAAAAMGANLLNLKPCIEIIDGKLVVVKKYRGEFTKSLGSYVKDRLAGREDVDRSRVFLTHTAVSPESIIAAETAMMQCGGFEHIVDAVAGCTISCHCGPGTLGLVYLRK